MKYSWVIFLSLLYVVFDESSADCPGGWVHHGNSCYLYLHEQYTWFSAQDLCHFLQGKLIEIESDEENHYLADFIRSHGASQVWIGLNDFAEEGVFVWTSSLEGVEQTFWHPGEPTDSGGNEDCVILRTDAGWVDYPCESQSVAAVCEQRYTSGPVIG